MVGRRGETPLVPPYRLRSPNKALALSSQRHTLRLGTYRDRAVEAGEAE